MPTVSKSTAPTNDQSAYFKLLQSQGVIPEGDGKSAPPPVLPSPGATPPQKHDVDDSSSIVQLAPRSAPQGIAEQVPETKKSPNSTTDTNSGVEKSSQGPAVSNTRTPTPNAPGNVDIGAAVYPQIEALKTQQYKKILEELSGKKVSYNDMKLIKEILEYKGLLKAELLEKLKTKETTTIYGTAKEDASKLLTENWNEILAEFNKLPETDKRSVVERYVADRPNYNPNITETEQKGLNELRKDLEAHNLSPSEINAAIYRWKAEKVGEMRGLSPGGGGTGDILNAFTEQWNAAHPHDRIENGDQAWDKIAQQYGGISGQQLQDQFHRYQADPQEFTDNFGGTLELKSLIIQLAGGTYSYKDEMASQVRIGNVAPVGGGTSWESTIINNYAKEHNISPPEVRRLLNLMRENPDSAQLKDMPEADRNSLSDVLRRIDAGVDYIDAAELKDIKQTDPATADILKTMGLEGATFQFERKLRDTDPEGWKIYEEAGKGSKGYVAYSNFAIERETILEKYRGPGKFIPESGAAIPSSTVDTLKIVSDVNNGKLNTTDAVRYFGAEIQNTIDDVNKDFVELESGWYDRTAMKQLSESDPELYAILNTKGEDAYKAALGEKVKAAIDTAITAAHDESIETKGSGVETWRVYDEWQAADKALVKALDRVDKENPNLSREELAKLYEQLPELTQYKQAMKAIESNRGVVSDVLAEALSPQLSWNPMEWKFGTIPTLTFNQEQLSEMYEDNVKITLAIYTGDTKQLKNLYDAGAFGDDKEAALDAYHDSLAMVDSQNAIKTAVEKGDLVTLEKLYNTGAFGEDKETYTKLHNYVRSGGRELAPITPADITAVKEALGTKKDFMKTTAESYPSGNELAFEFGLSMVPVVGTLHNWGKMGAAGKALSIVTDFLILAPLATAAARAARGIPVATGVAGRLTRAGRAMGSEALAQLRAPVDVIIHPVENVKSLVRSIKNMDIIQMAEIKKLPGGKITVKNPVARLSEWVITTSDNVVKIRIPDDLNAADALRARDKLTQLASQNTGRIILQIGNKRIELTRSALMDAVGGGTAHASPDIDKLLESSTVMGKKGFPAKEQGLFVSNEPALRFTTNSAFGKDIIPVANGATDKVVEISKYRVDELVKIDKVPVRQLKFSNAKNVPEDLADAIQNYTRNNDGIVYGSLNEYTKLKKAALPNDLDLVFTNKSKALNDIEKIANYMGYKTRRVPHAIEIYTDGVWKQIADVADIAEHKARLPEGLSQKVLTRVDGIRTETMGEQYLRQSLGAVSKTQKASERAERVNKAAGEVKKMLENAAAETRKPGVVIFSPEKSLRTVSSNKIYNQATELERKFVVGESLPNKEGMQHFYARIGPMGERIEIYLQNPISNARYLKLRAQGIIELAYAPFKEPIKIKDMEQLKNNAATLESAVREAGNVDEADDIRRIVTQQQAFKRALPLLGRAGVAGTAASLGVSANPVYADNIDNKIRHAYNAESRGHHEQADKFLKDAERLRDKVKKDGVENSNIRESLKNPVVRSQSYRKSPLSERDLVNVIAAVPELRKAAALGIDARVEATRLILDARRAAAQDLRDRQFRLLQVPRAALTRLEGRLSEPGRGGTRLLRGDGGRFVPRTGEIRIPRTTTPRVPRIPRIPRIPTGHKGRISLQRLSDVEKRRIIAESNGALAWKQGSVAGRGKNAERQDRWDTIVNPYSDDEHYLAVYGRPPRGATIIKRGTGSAYATAQMLYGKPPKEPFTVDSGFEDVHINAKGSTIMARFLPDPGMKTVSGITIGKSHNKPISERTKPISRPSRPIERSNTRISNVTRPISKKPRDLL